MRAPDWFLAAYAVPVPRPLPHSSPSSRSALLHVLFGMRVLIPILYEVAHIRSLR